METNNRRSGSPIRNSESATASPLNTPTRRRFISTPGSQERSNIYSDRFIPSRSSTNLEEAFDMMKNIDSSTRENRAGEGKQEAANIGMNNLLRSELLGQSILFNDDAHINSQNGSPARRESSGASNLFKYRSSHGSGSSSSHHRTGSHDSQLSAGSDFANPSSGFVGVQSPERRASLTTPKKPVRKISKTPYKVLDAPALQDDYYLNLVDWSHSNVLSVALGSCVYLWSANTSKVSKLCDLGAEDTVSSICWATSGNQISVGTNSGKILIWDASTCKMIREMAGHENRVGTMAWSSTLLASGSRDRNIYLQDIRIRGASSSSGSNTTGIGARSIPSTTASTPTRAYNTTVYSNVGSTNNSPSTRYSTGSPLTAAGNLGAGISGMLNLSTAMNAAGRAAPGSASRRASEGGYPLHIPSLPQPSDRAGYTMELDDGAAGSSVLEGSVDSDMPPPLPRALPRSAVSATAAVASPDVSRNGSGTSSGVGESNIASASPCVVRELSAHKQEVCGLKWSFDERMLASGGNDNKLFVWDAQHGHNSEPLCRFEDHTAAVKAVAWSPHQHGLLASGGGTADRHIRFWNALTSVPLHKIDTGSQVCNLMWSKNVNEIVSTHGYSLNQVIVWRYPSMQKVATLTGHTLRVLYLAMSPDGQNIVTGAGDETLRFWNVFPGPRSKTGYRIGPSSLTPSGSDIR